MDFNIVHLLFFVFSAEFLFVNPQLFRSFDIICGKDFMSLRKCGPFCGKVSEKPADFWKSSQNLPSTPFREFSFLTDLFFVILPLQSRCINNINVEPEICEVS